MAREVCAQVGSGTVPFVYHILPTDERGSNDDGQGIRTGTQVMLGNPEDLLAVDAFAVSGITVGTSPIQIVNAFSNPLPRCHSIYIQNTDSTNPVFIGHNSDTVLTEGWRLAPVSNVNAKAEVILPLLHNVPIWAAATGGSVNIRIMIF